MYRTFIHTRQRPFGSNDLFVVRRPRDFWGNTSNVFKSECYIVLGSKHNQELVPKAFEFLGNYVTLVENNALIEPHSNYPQVKCYELVCEPEEDDEQVFRSAGFVSKNSIIKDGPFHVVLLLKAFLKSISPSCVVRFERFTSESELWSDYNETCNLYHDSLNCIFLPGEEIVYSAPDNLHKDIVFTKIRPKCSFEFLKVTDHWFSSLCQESISQGSNSINVLRNYSKNYNPDASKSYCSDPTKSLSRKRQGNFFWDWLFNSGSKTEKTVTVSMFQDMHNVTIDRVILNQDRHDNLNGNNNFVSIDCSRTATSNLRSPQRFMKNHLSISFTDVPKPELPAGEQPVRLDDGNRIVDTPEGPIDLKLVPNYLRVDFLDFIREKLQSVDLTAINARSSIMMQHTSDEEIQPIPDICDGDKQDSHDCEVESLIDTAMSLRNLEVKINSSIDSITRLSYTTGLVEHEKITELSQKILKTIVHDLSNLEGLSIDQPFRLRLFSKTSYSDLVISDVKVQPSDLMKKWLRKHLRRIQQ